ncbi:hypothetical protein FRACYDRAFT_236271 [Fragilariopsis cylindrus CCMP1102]|uniref:Uncharacterized protein n=1 Tax=Fragilariopsis cylindrus CCMP1102 TaxID=635003 RepID=A0A1E7FPW9_9STRA|nr:hypothetical protein FRACYDRAFT_236271 [Fragilariopsis cylindrus CCMP1102]|eukprot:OEU20201.1 hypothetical protein FRACYDRAFT_236271 [Fragilariopsis cylindrus CCMP1102]
MSSLVQISYLRGALARRGGITALSTLYRDDVSCYECYPISPHTTPAEHSIGSFTGRPPIKVTRSYSYAKPEPTFTYLGLINDYNGVDVNQCKEYIEINASNYIDRDFTLHGLNDGFKLPTPDKPLSPMPYDSIAKVFDTSNSTVEGSAANKDLEKKALLFSPWRTDVYLCYLLSRYWLLHLLSKKI